MNTAMNPAMNHYHMGDPSNPSQYPDDTMMQSHMGAPPQPQQQPPQQMSQHDFGDENTMMVGSNEWHHMVPPIPSATPSLAGSTASGIPTKTGLPLQKRRRVTRACDECRRKKIKCDGKQPCTHCTVYSYSCTFDQPSNRRRNPAPQYIEALEHRLQRTEAFLKALLPGVDVNHPEFDAEKILPQLQEAIKTQIAATGNPFPTPSATNDSASEKDSPLESMVEATGRLDVDDSGHMDFHGHSSGVTYLAHLNHRFGDLLGEVKLGNSNFPEGSNQGTPASASFSPTENLPDTSVLPPRDTADVLVNCCLDQACVLMRFIHVPTFTYRMNRIYDVNPEHYEDDDNTFLPLLYLAMGVGCLFVGDAKKLGIEDNFAEATKFFNAGRRMIEMTDIRDIESLQAVILMVVFLQSSSRMSTCYSYVGIALSAAVRMGLHRKLPEARFNHIEREIRKRIFWTCWKMDTYVGALLGLPKGIAMEDVDQDQPAEVDDEYITAEGIKPQPEGQISSMVAMNAHTRLLFIMAKTVKYIYPLKGVESSVTGGGDGYTVNQSKVHEIELDLGAWLESLPKELRPGTPPNEFIKCQYLLKMSFAHVQMILYRPFVHYLTKPKTKDCDERPYAIAAACVNVARKIVHTADEMNKHGILNGAYWFSIYTTFFSVITLIYYVLVSPADTTSLAILNDAKIGKESLASIQNKSMAARRCSIALAPLFDKIPESFGAGIDAAQNKKRGRQDSRCDGISNTETNTETNVTNSTGTVAPSRPPNGSGKQSTQIRAFSLLDALPPPPPRRSTSSAASSPTIKSPRNADGFSQPPGQNDVKPEQQSPPDQEMTFQAQLNTGVPDLTSMMFPDQFSFSTSDNFKPDGSVDMNGPGFTQVASGNNYGSLEGSLLGPIPPYLLQGQQMDGMNGLNNQSQQNGQNDQGSMSQYLMGSSGGEAMVPDFFRDEWDDVLMQQTFRNV